jgi:hypothetical protein
MERVMPLLLALSVGACGSDATTPDEYRFGQTGTISVVLDIPTSADGLLQQTIRWGSTGEWSLQEQISYRGLVGDQRFERHVQDLELSKLQYIDAITHLNDNPGESLFIDSLSTDVQPDCGPGRTRITFSIQDEKRFQSKTWVRCAEGSLGNLDPSTAAPGFAAARLVQAVQTVRLRTVEADGQRFKSQYVGSLPFGTLDRGEASEAALSSPVVFTTFDPWQNFWAQHAGLRPIPAVDFERDMVVVAMVGPRTEAGDSVEIRRILQLDHGTLTEYVERVPGDYCSPAGRIHTPYHVVVAPKTSQPFQFSELPREEISCGG